MITAENILQQLRVDASLVHQPLPLEISDSIDFALAAMRINYCNFFLLSERLKNDPDIASIAIKSDMMQIYNIGQKLRGDSDFILKHLHSWNIVGKFFQLCSEELKDNRDFTLSFLAKNAWGLEFVRDEFKSDKEIVLVALNNDPDSYRFLTHFKDDGDVIDIALKSNANLQYLPDYILSDKEKILLSLSYSVKGRHRDNILKSVATIKDNLKYDKDFWVQAIGYCFYVFKDAPDILKEDCELLSLALKEYDKKLDYSYDNHIELIMPQLNDMVCFGFASANVINNTELMLEVLKNEPFYINYMGEDVKKMFGSNLKACRETIEKIVQSQNFKEYLDTSLDKRPEKNKLKI